MGLDVLIHSGPEIALENPFFGLQCSSMSGQSSAMGFLQDGVSHGRWCKQDHPVGLPRPSKSSVQDSVIDKAVVLVQFAKPEVFSVVLWQGVGVQQLLQCH